MKRMFFSILVLAFIVTGCGDGGRIGGTPSTTTKTVPISITIDNLQKPSSVSNKPASSIKITVSATDISTIEKNVQVNGRASITETFDIIPGLNRTFAADIFDAEGMLILTGSTTKNIPETVPGGSTYVIVSINVSPVTTTTTTTVTDTTPPDTSISTQPSALTNSTSPVFTFSSTESGSTYECQMDSGGYFSCSSPKIYAGVSAGSHTFYVRAIDSSGNTDASPASYTWTIDTTAPTVSSVNPTNGASGIAINTTVTATFSENMDSSTIIVANFTLNGGGAVAGTVSYDSGSKTATFTPSSSLSYSTTYIATITTSVKDSEGNAMSSNYTWSFTAGTAPDTTPPNTTITGTPSTPTNSTTAAFTFTSTEAGSTFQCQLDSGNWINCISGDSITGLSEGSHTFNVRATDTSGNTDPTPASYTWAIDATAPTVSSVNPVNGATNINISSTITATFSESIDSSTVTTSTFTVSGGVIGAVTYSGTTATFTPSSSLAYSTTYTATITTGVKDLSGNTMASNYTWSFTTGAAPDTTPPTVQSISPSNGATNVSVSTTATATFSEAMDPATITTSTFSIAGVTGLVSYSGTTATLTPTSNLSYNTTYTETVTTGVTDVVGNAMASNYTWSFTTEHGYQFVTKWGSYGSANGQFAALFDIAVDTAGNVYVSDAGNNRIQKFDSTGTFITKWGSSGIGDGQFNGMRGVAVDTAGNVYVVESGNRRIQKFDSNGNFITKWGSLGSGDGQFNNPNGVAVDSLGNVYVADTLNNRIQKFDSSGNFITKWGSYGSTDGQFGTPWGIAVDSSGNVYVADVYNSRIQKFDSNGTFITKWGTLGSGNGKFNEPYGVAVDSSGNVYISDRNNNRIQKFTYQ